MIRLATACTNALRGVAHMQRRGLACTTLYIKGISLNTTSEQLKELSEKYGNVYQANVVHPQPTDRFAIGFVRFYAGDYPSQIRDVSILQDPPQDEIDASFACAQRMIKELDGKIIDGGRLNIQVSKKDKPNCIQFRARLQLHAQNNPESSLFNGRMKSGTNIDHASYAHGYRNGFRDGLLKAKLHT